MTRSKEEAIKAAAEAHRRYGLELLAEEVSA